MLILPNRRSSTSPAKPPRGNFRQRYDELESHRSKLVERLTTLDDAARQHAGYRNALKLLNDTFRRSTLTQRLAVLQSAAWLIGVLEKIASMT